MEFKKARPLSEKYPPDWPPQKYFFDPHNITESQLIKLRELIDKSAGETEIDGFVRANQVLLAVCLSFFNTGYTGSWIIPQQEIKPPSDEPGLKPDYIVGGNNSDGFSWWIIDLKGASEPIFVERQKRIYFSNVTNRGVFQVLEYMEYCERLQSYMRVGLKLTDFSRAQGLLIIGREQELENDRKAKLRSAWNRLTNGNLHVRTYDALLRTIDQKIFLREKISQK